MKLPAEIVVLVIWLAALAFLQNREADDAQFTAREVAAVQDRKAIDPEQLFPLTYPLDCDATVRISVHDHAKEQPRCYSRKDSR